MSAETIYQSLYIQARGGLKRELTAYLRTGRSMRKPCRTPGHRRTRIPDMVMISERPAEVEDRAIPGHWEGDLIMGSKSSDSSVGTLVERTTGFLMLLHLPDGHGTLAVQEALVAKMLTLDEHLRRSLTWDQGREMTNHRAMAEATGMEIYFATHTHLGSAVATRTPTGSCASTCPRAATCRSTALACSTTSPPVQRPAPQATRVSNPAEKLDEILTQNTNHPGVA